MTRDARWTISAAIVEGGRNLRAPLKHTILLILIAATVGGGFTVAELSTTQSVIEFERALTKAGDDVLVAEREGSGLPTAECVSLESLSGIYGAGGVKRHAPIRVVHAPGSLYQLASVTVGVLDLLDPTVAYPSNLDGVILGGDAAAELGVIVGSWIQFGDGNHEVQAILSDSLRTGSMGRWILTVMPPVDTVDQCWVEFDRGVRTGRQETLESTFPLETDIRQVIALDTFSRKPVEELRTRPQRHGWWIAGALMAGVAWMRTWARRREIGLYRSLGTKPADLMLLGVIDAVVPLVLGMVVGCIWAFTVWALYSGSVPSADQSQIVLRSILSSGLLALVTAPLGWLALAYGDIVRQLKEP